MNLLNLCYAFNELADFQEKNFLSKKITLKYLVESFQPWLHFKCKDNDKLFFKLHDLEVKSEAPFLHLAAQKGKDFLFEGFIEKGYSIGFGKLRGYVKVPEDNYEIGVVIRAGRAIKVRTREEIVKSSIELISPIIENIVRLEEISNLKKLK